ncbi:MAG: hypothetical protein ABI689_11510 [Thermoanaerobaculia bacterium]
MLLRQLAHGSLFVLCAAQLDATSYVIATLSDDAVNNGNCTLREALRAADTNLPVDSCAAGGSSDTINLPNGTYPFAGGEVLTASGSLTIQSQTLNPFNVSIDLGNAGNFIYLQGGGSFVLDGLEIKNGMAPGPFFLGGAIDAHAVSLEIRNFRFLSNHATTGGGAVNYESNAATNLFVHNGAFLSNGVLGNASSASAGGAARVSALNGADADFRDVTFLGNSAASSSGFAVQGGALRFETDSSGSIASCSRCSFQNNTAVSTVSAGATGAFHSTAFNGSTTQLLDCRFSSNSATGGGANLKAAAVAAGSNSGSTVLFERLFVDFNGGAAADPATYDMVLDGFGGTMALVDSQLTFGAAGGLNVTTNSIATLGHLTIADYSTFGATLVANSGQILLQNSIVAFSVSDLGTAGNVVQTTNFIGGDPLFLNEPGGDYHLSASSLALGSGTNGAVSVRLADLEHHGRIVGVATDIGCYEFDGLFADNFEVRDTGSWSATMP